MKGNIVVGQSGGPTAVINSSVAGVYAAAKELGVKKVYGMVHGIEGFLEDRLIELEDYLEERKTAVTKDEKEDALFLSSQGKRINVRSVQNLVKKYSSGVTVKNISPHKLRSTFGTNLYQETGDIYLVADALGHADVNTTRKHYAEVEEYRRRMATSKIRLRKD